MGAAVANAVAFPIPDKEKTAAALLARNDALYLTTEDGDRVSCVHIRRAAAGTDRVILYSHGNAEDLGQRLPYLDMMSQICGADVFAYDYCGYGLSEGKPSEESCLAAIEAAYEYLLQYFDSSRIMVFGRSIGSGPTVDLAVQHPEIRGMILQSPFESCGRTIFGNNAITSWIGYSIDLFKNYEKIGDVTCPVLVMHGTLDDIVPVDSGVAIYEACQNAVEPLWVEDAGHNDMPADKCLRRVREFLDELDGLSWGWNIFVTNLATHISVQL
jgi:pimeloyl-ACP methyl ester carboxylesterase